MYLKGVCVCMHKGSPHVAQGSLELLSLLISFPSAGTTEVCHHAWLGLNS